MIIEINDIKDAVTIVFYLIASIIAILTYIRAKATILQPKRNELIKKQTELFAEFLSFLNQYENSLDNGFDYLNIFNYNIDLSLRDAGLFEIDQKSEKYLAYNSNISGWIQFLENDIYNFIFVKENLEGYDNLIFNKDERIRQKYYLELLKKESFEIYRIFFTEKHETFYRKFRDFSTNPFLPSEIQKLCFDIAKDMQNNIHGVLRVLLKKLVIESFNAHNNLPESDKIVLTNEFRHHHLFRIYEKERIKHDEKFQSLKKSIRKHLNIDEKW